MAENVIITIARGFGSGGRTIGKMLADELDISFYDCDLIQMAAEKSGINESLFASIDERIKPGILKRKMIYSDELIEPGDPAFTSDKNLFNYLASVIKDVAEKESCIIVGRCADYVLKGHKNLTRVFVYAEQNFCVDKVVTMYNLNEKEALEKIRKIDKERENYYKCFTGNDWDNVRNYDLCLNSSELGFEKCVEIIKSYLKIRENI